MATVITFRGRPDAAQIIDGPVPAEITLPDGTVWVGNTGGATHAVGQSTQTTEYVLKKS